MIDTNTILTFEQLRLVIVVYTSAIIPLILIPYLTWKNFIPSWIIVIYMISFIACALGWEIWFTYGLFEGDNVDLRRASQLSVAIPMHINWLLNSLADAGTICIGGLLLTWRILNKNNAIFKKWHWSAFFILLFIFIGQNIFVETFLYHDQLSNGTLISWAPFSPLGSWINPILFNFSDRTVSLQNQVPWLLMTPLFYGFLIYYVRKNKNV